MKLFPADFAIGFGLCGGILIPQSSLARFIGELHGGYIRIGGNIEQFCRVVEVHPCESLAGGTPDASA